MAISYDCYEIRRYIYNIVKYMKYLSYADDTVQKRSLTSCCDCDCVEDIFNKSIH